MTEAMLSSIKTKLIAIYAAVIIVVMIVSGTIMLMQMRNMEINRTLQQLRARADAIVNQVVQPLNPQDFNNADIWALIGQADYEIEGLIMNDLGIPIAPESFIGMRFSNQATMAAMNGEEGFAIARPGPDRRGAGIERQWISFAMPVYAGDTHVIVYTRISTEFMNESLANVVFTLVIMVLVAISLTLIMWFFLANAITSPIIRLTQHAKAIAAGKESRPITPKSKDEIGQLISSFNHMETELGTTLTNITSERNKREAILQNTSHGVLAYDAAGQLTHTNHASGELLTGLDINHHSLGEVLEFLGLKQEELREEVQEVTYQHGDYFMQAGITAYTSTPGKIDGYIIVLQDISRQMKLDNMRKEFVANVSHELRTPLTSILTYAQTLMEGALEEPKMAMDFLKVIEDEAQRMTLLVSDLLELSRIDSKHVALEMDVVDLVALLRMTVRQSQFFASTKEQKIEATLPQPPCFIEANTSRINQVVTNILSNAIKYSPEKTTMTVDLETTDSHYKVHIKDQGMGIPEESLPRIFERFYRVDKARARAMGGTGLGLAIVKEIMEEHGGSVSIASEMGAGTTMVLTFKKLEE